MIIPAVFAFSGGDATSLQVIVTDAYYDSGAFESMGLGRLVGIMFFHSSAVSISSTALTER